MSRKKIDKVVEHKIWELNDLGHSQNEISRRLDVSVATVSRYIKKMEAEEYIPPEVSAKEILKHEEKSMTTEEKMELAFNDSIDLLYTATQKAKAGYEVTDERGVKIALKTLMDCIEKAGKHAKTMADAAKAARKGITPETIDYQEMAKLYVSFNKETGKFDYDAKKHMQEVLDKAYKKES